MTWAFGRDHEDVHVGRGLDEFEMDVEAVAEGEVFAFFQVRLDVFTIDVRGGFVRRQHHDDVRLARRFRGVEDWEALFAGFFAGGAFRIEAYADVHSAIPEVERM